MPPQARAAWEATALSPRLQLRVGAQAAPRRVAPAHGPPVHPTPGGSQRASLKPLGTEFALQQREPGVNPPVGSGEPCGGPARTAPTAWWDAELQTARWPPGPRRAADEAPAVVSASKAAPAPRVAQPALCKPRCTRTGHGARQPRATLAAGGALCGVRVRQPAAAAPLAPRAWGAPGARCWVSVRSHRLAPLRALGVRSLGPHCSSRWPGGRSGGGTALLPGVGCSEGSPPAPLPCTPCSGSAPQSTDAGGPHAVQ